MKKNLKPIPALALIREYKNKDSFTPSTLHSIRLRIHYHDKGTQKRVYFSTDFAFTEKDWEAVSKTNPTKKYQGTHDEVFQHLDRAKTILKGFQDDGIEFSVSRFKKAWLNKRDDGEDFWHLFRQKYRELKSEHWKTAVLYKLAYKSFLTFNDNVNVTFSDCSVEFLTDWQAWMERGADKPEFRKTRSAATISMYARCARHIWNRAVKRGFVKATAYPFGNDDDHYKIPTGKNKPTPLTLEEVSVLEDYKPKIQMEVWAKSFWLFSYYCQGVNAKDICLLKWENVTEDEIRFERSKTRRTLKEPIVITAVRTGSINDIIEAFSEGERSPDSFVFPMLNARFYRFNTKTKTKEMEKVKAENMDRRISQLVDQFSHYCNKGLSRFAVKILKKKVTMYDARDSWASNSRDQGASPLFIMEGMGHTNFKTTQNYLDRFPTAEKNKHAQTMADAVAQARAAKKAREEKAA